MNSKYVMVLVSLFSALIFQACSQISSKEVEASAIFGEIKLHREEVNTNVNVSASFWVGGPTGTVVRLETPANVKINGRDANEVSDVVIGTIHYDQNLREDEPFAKVNYTDKEGVSYLNTLNMPGKFSLSVNGTSATKVGGFSFNYSSEKAFESGEKLSLVLRQDGLTSWSEHQIVSGAKSGVHQVTVDDLRDFSPGPLTISICRTKRPSATQPYPKGTDITVESCAVEDTISLKN